jgi:hypothetical protein
MSNRASTDEVLRGLNFEGRKILYLQGIVPDVPPFETALDLDAAIVGSRLDVPYLRRCGVPESRVHAVGYADYDSVVNMDRAAARTKLERVYPHAAGRNLVVFTSQYKTSAFPDWARLTNLNVIADCARRRPDWYFLIKPHPRLETLSDSFLANLPANAAVSTQFPTIEALSAAQVAVTYWSTTALEAVLLGTPLVQLNATGLPDFFPLAERMGQRSCRDATSLLSQLDFALTGPGKADHFARRQVFLQEYQIPLDGNSSTRAAQAILAAL